MLNSLDKKIFDKKFVEFLVEKRIHPSHLLKLAHQINSKALMNEEGMTGFLGGVGGGLKGLYQGFKAGWGTEDINKAEDTLQTQLDFAYRTFSNSIEKATGNKATAQDVLQRLRDGSAVFTNAAIDKPSLISGRSPTSPSGGSGTDWLNSLLGGGGGSRSPRRRPLSTRTLPTTSPAASPAAPVDPEDSDTPVPIPEPTPPPTAPSPSPAKLPTGSPISGLTPSPSTSTKSGGADPIDPPKMGPEKEKTLGNLIEKDFLQNFNDVVNNIFYKIEKDGDYIKAKFPFKTLNVIKRLYKYKSLPLKMSYFDFSTKNMRVIGTKNWREMIKEIVRVFEANDCKFGNEEFIKDIENTFNGYYDVGGYYPRLIADISKDNENWRKLIKSLKEIGRYIDDFCLKNPKKCSDKGGAYGEKLLNNLEENRNITFAEWLLIEENILF